MYHIYFNIYFNQLHGFFAFSLDKKKKKTTIYMVLLVLLKRDMIKKKKNMLLEILMSLYVIYFIILYTQAGLQKGIFCLTQKRPPIRDLPHFKPAHIKHDSCQCMSVHATPKSDGPIGWEQR